MRKFHQNRQPIFPPTEWEVIETAFDQNNNHRNESIFSLGNGYLGLRGTLEEGLPEHMASTPGTYLNGIYETEPIIYGEFMACQPQEYQSMINVTDWHGIKIDLAGEEFTLFEGKVSDYRRVLDLKQGVLRRELIWTSPRGKQARICFERFISQAEKQLACQQVEITPINFSGQVIVHSRIEGDVRNFHHLRERALKVVSLHGNNETGYIISRTQNSKITIACGVTHKTIPATAITCVKKEQALEFSACFNAMPNEPFSLEKFVAFSTCRETDPEQLTSFVSELSKTKAQAGYIAAKQAHVRYLEAFWADTDVEIKGDPLLQQGLRFNALQLLQSTGRDGKTNIAAKGLTGEYYEGHYFWDTETYIVPFFLYSRPELVRKLLEYRYSILDAARENAKRMGDQGALYAWRTINGHEASGNFLGSTVQYHINAAVAFAIHKYYEATEDSEFMQAMGAEILFETARCWAHRGVFLESRGGRYCINEVCGPDEYKPGVNNNCYTNYMAQFNLRLALRAKELLESKYPQRFQELSQKLELTPTEFKRWQKCADLMYLPFNEELGIHPQDDSFLDKDPIDIDSIPAEEIPLVANWHPLRIWRYQLIKQADVILLMFLLSDEFSLAEKKANFDYYEPKTTHDSSLSPAIYSIIAAELGYKEFAYNYFLQTVRLDLDDYNRNAWQGLHTACMASSWLGVVNGFAGMRTTKGRLSFRPYVPEQWESYSFKLKFKGAQLQVTVKPEATTYRLLAGEKLTFSHFGREISVTIDRAETIMNYA